LELVSENSWKVVHTKFDEFFPFAERICDDSRSSMCRDECFELEASIGFQSVFQFIAEIHLNPRPTLGFSACLEACLRISDTSDTNPYRCVRRQFAESNVQLAAELFDNAFVSVR